MGTGKMKWQILISSLILLFAAAFATSATINVPGDYGTIQEAIDAAVDGDEVVVADSVYTGSNNRDLDFGNGLPFGQTRAITVRSANGPANCTIDCQGLGRAFNFDSFEDNNSVVEGFTITGGSAGYGGGIECYFASPKISNCIIRENSAYDGGGIDCYYASPTIVDCIIAGNTADNDGAGVECWEAMPAIINCLIQSNSAGNYGGAIDCYYSSPTITNCTIADNSGASDDSGGVFANYPSSSPTITNCIVWGNGDDLTGCTATYSCIEDGDAGAGNISDEPLFRTGPLGDYYLSQTAAGQLADSNCVDAGIGLASALVAPNSYTTRTDSISDTSTVDMGYHYPDSGPYVNYQLTTSVVVVDPNATGTISVDPDTGGTYRQFAEVALTATPDDIGYKVKEWTGADNVPAPGEPNNIVTMAGNKTVTVEFEPRIRYWLTTFVVNGVGGSIAPNSGWQYEGDTVLLTATPDLGYQVFQWTGTNDDSSVDLNNYVTMDSDKTVSVEFVTAFVHLDVSVVGGNGTISPSRGGNYPIGTVVNLKATPDLNYMVKEWTGTDDDSSKDPNNTVTMTEDKSVTVEFEPIIIYELTTSIVDGNGTVVPTTPWVDYNSVAGTYSYYAGTTVTVEASPDTGWHVEEWTVDGNSIPLNPTDPYHTTVTIDSNRAVTVTFAPGFPIGQIWVCHPNGVAYSGPYGTIQAAIDDANGGFSGFPGDPEATPVPLPEIPAIPGDLIIVADGLYTGPGNYNLDFRDAESFLGLDWEAKHITLRSENGPEKCIIDCNGLGRGFYLHSTEDNNSVIEGFIIRNGSAEFGGGISIEGIAAPVVRNCIITNCNTGIINGGGVYLEGLDEEDTTYDDYADAANAAADAAEEGLITDPEDPNYDPSAIARAIAARTAAIYVGELVGAIGAEDAPVPTIANCKITNNTADSHGGGIFCTLNTTPTIISTEISGNSAGRVGLPGANGGGIYSEGENTTPAIINCLIVGNTSIDIGGAIYLYQSAAVINLCTIADNYGLDYGDVDEDSWDRPYGPKGGICAREADPEISNCIIWGNGDDLYECAATYSCIEDLVGADLPWGSDEDDGEGNIGEDPMFMRGPLGYYYLFQRYGDPTRNSPCIDAGEEYILGDLQSPPQPPGSPFPDGYNLDIDITTSIGNDYDLGVANMGYHYPRYVGPPIMYELRIDVIGNGHLYVEGYGTVFSGQTVFWQYQLNRHVYLHALPELNHWGYWQGTDDDESHSQYNDVTMYGDRHVTVTFEPILRRKLHVPADYSNIKDAIDTAKYKDEIVLAAGGAGNPYHTSVGYTIRRKVITITSVDPNDPAVVAATVIEVEYPESPETSGYTGPAFNFIDVGRDTVLMGVTITMIFDRGAPDGQDGDETLEPGENGHNNAAGAILCINASPTIKNCVITDCNIFAGDGGDGMPGIEEHPDGMAGGWPGGCVGGGMALFENSDPLIINCTFNNCSVQGGNGGDGGDGFDYPPGPWGYGGRGGGWYYGTDSVWYNVPWPYAYSQHKWGYMWGATPLGDPNVDFYDFYTYYSGLGGAVFVGQDSDPRFIDCTFTNNRCEGGVCGVTGIDGEPMNEQWEPGLRWKIDSFGGAVFCDDYSSAVFENCTFSNNIASPNRPMYNPDLPYDPITNYDNDDVFVGFGGAVAFKNNANVTFENCTFNGNLADKGGAIHSTNADPKISDCNFMENSAQSGGAVLFARGYGKIARSNFVGNEATGDIGRGGGICSLGSNALIVDCKMNNNSAAESGGGVYISSKDASGNDLVIEGETVFGYNQVVLLNCLITGNFAGEDGGGISANWDSDPNIFNCTIADNIAGSGPGTGYGGGIYGSYGSYTNIIDSIIWGNEAENGPQISVGVTAYPSTVDISFSDVQGAQSDANIADDCNLIWDPNNLYVDPLFVTGPLGDYYLSQMAAGQAVDSSCVDAGSNFASRVGMSKYTTRTDEVFDMGKVDMGYHHSFTSLEQLCKFCNLLDDGIINFADFAILASSWLDEGCSYTNDWCLNADITFDTQVDHDDLLMLAECWLVGDTSPPIPNPCQWEIKPYSASATAPYRISMTAKHAIDIWSDVVEYYFECAYGDCYDRDWGTSNTYTDTGLNAATEYGYRVKARDKYGNETGWSPIKYAITGEEPPPPGRVVGNMMLINDNAGWCWYQDDKIIYDPVGGNILTSTAAEENGFGGIGGDRLNDMDATTFNIATGQRTVTQARDSGGGDDHNMGAFWIRPDGRYLHLYCPHYTNQTTYYRLSTNPNDGSSWASEQSYNWETISGLTDTYQSSSYTNVYYLSGEGTGNGRLYNIHRIFERTPCISYSDDWGVTWQYMGRLNSPVGGETYSNFYHKFRSNGVDRIDFIGCEQHPRNYNNSVFHGYIKGGKSYDSYGNVIDDNLYDQDAPSIQEFTPVFTSDPDQGPGTYHTAWTNELELDAHGHPVCLFQTRYGTDKWGSGSGQNTIGAADHRFFYGRFDGSSWTIMELCKMGTGLHAPEQDYIGMGCIHPDNANLIYISTPFDPRDDSALAHHEIFKGVTSDNGATWDWTQITIDSTEDNIRPAIPQWDAYNTAVFWTRGEYPGQEDYDFVLVGIVEQENETIYPITYIDATKSNTEESDGTAFTPTGPSGSVGASDNQWHEYTGYGNGGSCYTAGDFGTENAPTIKTTISGLSDGIYDVFAYFWCDPSADWGVRGGFTSSDLLCFNKQSSQYAEASQFSGSVEVLDTGVALYRVYIGRKEVSGGTSVDVYLDNYDGSYSGNVPTRTTYDGVGVAIVSYTEDITPPTPDPMTWAVPSYTATEDSITLFATTATDTTGVKYYFENFDSPGVNSGWIGEPTWTDVGLMPDTTYVYRVRARDTSPWQNETGWSVPLDATTLEEGEEPNEPEPEDTNPPAPDPSQWAVDGEPSQYYSGGYYWHTMTAEPTSDATTGGSEPVQYYFELVVGDFGTHSSGWQLSNVYNYQVALNPKYGAYKVKAKDAAGNETGWSITLEAE